MIPNGTDNNSPHDDLDGDPLYNDSGTDDAPLPDMGDSSNYNGRLTDGEWKKSS